MVLLYGQLGQLLVHGAAVEPVAGQQAAEGQQWGRDWAGQAETGLRWVWFFQGELYRMCQESLDCDPKVAEILAAHPDLLGDR